MQNVNPAGRDMYIGVDYYPEHWPRERWKTDIELMKEAGFNVVRLAEFAWINMEPVEGRLLQDADVRPLTKPPAGVEVSVRQGSGQRILFVINHTEQPQTVDVPADKLELLSETKTKDKIQLDVFGVAVIKL